MKHVWTLAFIIASLTSACEPQVLDQSSSPSQNPSLTERVSFDHTSREQFQNAIRKFAEHQGFAIRIAPSEPSGEHIVIQLRRKDVEIIAINPFEIDEFRINFYPNGGDLLAEPELQALVAALRVELASVPSIKVVQ